MTDFAALMGQKPSEVTPPKPLPAGTFLATITDIESIVSREKKTPGLRVKMMLVSAEDDVDEEELAEYGDLGENATTSMDMYVTEKSLFRVTQFVEHCGLDLDDYDTTQEAVDATVGNQCNVLIEHQYGDNGEVYSRPKSTSKVD